MLSNYRKRSFKNRLRLNVTTHNQKFMKSQVNQNNDNCSHRLCRERRDVFVETTYRLFLTSNSKRVTLRSLFDLTLDIICI